MVGISLVVYAGKRSVIASRPQLRRRNNGLKGDDDDVSCLCYTVLYQMFVGLFAGVLLMVCAFFSAGV